MAGGWGVAAIMQGAVIRAVLESLGLLTAAPGVASARGPPELAWEVPAE